MDYEQKYKEALNKAQRLSIDGFLDAVAISDIFPELQENEDERIRKWCISHFNACINVIKDNDEYKEYLSNKVIAWLEKQGEKKNTRKREIHDAYLQGVIDAKHEIEKQGKKLDADDVWLQNYLSNVICFVNQFKKDFGL